MGEEMKTFITILINIGLALGFIGWIAGRITDDWYLQTDSMILMIVMTIWLMYREINSMIEKNKEEEEVSK